MRTVMLACEMLRLELDLLAGRMTNPPEIFYLDMKLHHTPDKLRKVLQEHVTALERETEGPLTVLFGYALCGRALCGVTPGRARLVIPRVHDCVPLFLGLPPKEALRTVPGPILWISPGVQGDLSKYLLQDDPVRLAELEKKYGPVRAAKLLAAERRMFENYERVCYIRWNEVGEGHVPDAQRVAKGLALRYTEYEGSSGYLAELLAGGKDPEKFLHLTPGQTLDMDTDGGICASCVP